MSDFWDGFSSATDAAIETMGEEVKIDGHLVKVLVDDLDFREGAAPGGRKSLVSARLLVPYAVVLRDGMEVQVRGMAGRVESWVSTGPLCHHQVTIGPFNRWSGTVPGV